MNDTIKSKARQEAAERLRILEEMGLMPQVRKEFVREGKLNYSERMTLPPFGTNGILYWLDNVPELAEAVRDFEEEHDAVAYHATFEVLRGIGRILDVFYVSRHESEWKLDREDLRCGRSVVYAKNLDDDMCSEFGHVWFEVCGGGLVRTA